MSDLGLEVESTGKLLKHPSKWSLSEIVMYLRGIRYLGFGEWRAFESKNGRAKTHLRGFRYDDLLDAETARAVVAWDLVQRGELRLSTKVDDGVKP